MRASGEPGRGLGDRGQGSARGKGLLGGQECGWAGSGWICGRGDIMDSQLEKQDGRGWSGGGRRDSGPQTLAVQELTSEPPR